MLYTSLNLIIHAKDINQSYDFLMCSILEGAWLVLRMFLDQTLDFGHRKGFDYQHVALNKQKILFVMKAAIIIKINTNYKVIFLINDYL